MLPSLCLLLLLFVSTTNGVVHKALTVTSEYLIDGCPMEEHLSPKSLEERACIRLFFYDDEDEPSCGRKLWRSNAQLVYHVASNTTTVTTRWEEIEKVRRTYKGWKITKMDGEKMMLTIGEKVTCAANRPEISVGVFINHILYTKPDEPIDPSRGPIAFCYDNDAGYFCKGGPGYCVVDQYLQRSCQCPYGYRGPKCLEAFDPFGIDSERVNTYPTAPEFAHSDTCNILLAEGCPDEQEDECIKLRYQLGGIYHCSRRMWRSTGSSTPWERIEKLVCDGKDWKFVRSSATDSEERLLGNSRVQCSHTLPKSMPILFGTNTMIHYCFRNNNKYCLNGGHCIHYYPTNDVGANTGCVCRDNFSGETCGIPISYDPTCSIPLIDGCPMEMAEKGECTTLRESFKDGLKTVDCPHQLWASPVFNWQTNHYDFTWKPIDKMDCKEGIWNIYWIDQKQITTTNPTGIIGQPFTMNKKVMCSSSQPTLVVDFFHQHWNIYVTRSDFAKIKQSPVAFCPVGTSPSPRCVEGLCVLTYKNEHYTTSCSCHENFFGPRCDIQIPRDRKCSVALVDGCPKELAEIGHCEKLRMSNDTMTAECPHKLLVSKTQAVYHEYSQTNTYSTRWDPIDKLHCDHGLWMIYFKSANETTERSQIYLDRKVMCSQYRPSVDADAFMEHQFYLPREDLTKVKPSPVAFCPVGTLTTCTNGYCVLTYKDDDYSTSCACKYGYRGASCYAYDPFDLGDELKRPAPKQIEEPLPNAVRDTCNVLLAEGCPDLNYETCDRLRLFDNAVYCTKQLWVSRDNGHEFDKIDALECVDKRWQIVRDKKREALPYKERVQCATKKPYLRELPSVAYKEFNDEDTDELETFRFFCFRNAGTCQNGLCVSDPYYSCKNHHANCAVSTCFCDDGFFGSDCSIPMNLRRLDYSDKFGSPLTNNRTIEIRKNDICDSSKLVDGCNNGHCEKLRASSSNVTCSKLLWLNYGGEMILDWHEISGVSCIDHVWRSDCSKVIGNSLLVCSSSRPSFISNSLWMIILVAGVVLVLSLGLACAMCLICRQRRKVKQALASARTPHSSACPSSTQHSENTVTSRED